MNMASSLNPSNNPNNDGTKGGGERDKRRLERILRNRKAAQVSREKKRKYVQFLEQSISKLEQYIDKLQGNYQRVMQNADFQAIRMANLVYLDDYDDLIHHIRYHIQRNNYNNERINGNKNSQAGTTNRYKDSINSKDVSIGEPVLLMNNLDATANIDVSPTSTVVTLPVIPDTDSFTLEPSQNTFVNEPLDDSVYYSYLANVSLNMPWDKHPRFTGAEQAMIPCSSPVMPPLVDN